jgi:hypothetical protein
MPQGGMEQPQGFAQGGMVGDVPGYAFGGFIRNLSKPVTATPAQDPQYWTSAKYRENMNEEQQREYDMANPYINAAAEKAAYEKRLSDKSAYEAQQRAAAEAAARPVPRGGFRGIFGRGFGNIFNQVEPQVEAQPAQSFSGISRLFSTIPRFLGNSSTAPDPTDTTVNRRDINPAYLAEFTRRFQQNQAPQVTQQSMLLPTQQYGLTMPQGGFAAAPQYGTVPTPQVGFAQGGYVNGNFSEGVAQAGRNGDTVLAHMTPEQHQYLTELGGGATVNPETGLPEHYMGMQALGNMGTAIASRAAPFLQQANVLAGRALYNPTFSAPVLNQARDASGRFGAMSVDGMNAYYPTLTQGIANSRAGQMVAQKASQGANYLANMPGTTKAMAALMAIPGASVISNSMGGGGTTPNMPSSDVPGAIVTDDKGGRSYAMPEVQEDVAPESTPIDYNNLPVSPGAAAPVSEAERNNQLIQANLNKPRTRGERLDEYMAENVPIFEKYMGGDSEYNKAQALFVLADMGLKFASTRKPGDTFASAFARSAQGVPAGLSAIAAQEEANKRQIKSAALTSGLQTLAAEDKATSDLRKEIIKKQASGQKVTYDDLGAGMYRVKDSNGRVIGHEVDPIVKDEFVNNPIVPMKKSGDKEYVRTSPYATITSKPAATVRTEALRKNIESDMISAGDMVSMLDETMKDIASVYGPGAWATDFKNNVIVPITPNLVASPDTDFEGRRSNVAIALKRVNTSLAKEGDTGNVAVYERKLVEKITGKDPAAFFADPELIMKNMMAIRTHFANQYYRKAAQVGHTDYDIKLQVPNLGTMNDPIPQDKLPYLKQLAETNPNGQVYVKFGKTVEPVFLNTLK